MALPHWYKSLIDRRAVLERIDAAQYQIGSKERPIRTPETIELFKNALTEGRARIKTFTKGGSTTEEIECAHTYLMEEIVRLAHEYVKEYVLRRPISESVDRSALLIVPSPTQYATKVGRQVIDLHILVENKLSANIETYIENLLYVMWDMQLNVGHAVRTISDSIQISKLDTKIRESLLDARFLCGDEGLYAEFRHRFLTETIAKSEPAQVRLKQFFYNPFRPGGIVEPTDLSGRSEERIILEQMLFETKHKNPQCFMILGQKGIGKSSLMLYHEHLSQGEIQTNSGMRFNFLTINVVLQESDTFSDIIEKTDIELNAAVKRYKRLYTLALSAWNFLTRWEALGVKYRGQDQAEDERSTVDDLSRRVAELVEASEGKLDGVVFLYDEADKPAASGHLGAFCKIFTEQLVKKRCLKVSVGLAGLPVLLSKLQVSHESAPRIFKTLTLGPLGFEECSNLIRSGLEHATERNEIEVSISEQAERVIIEYSEGLPHMLQQFAYSAFQANTDSTIDIQDAIEGATGKNGALFQLGVEYFREKYFDPRWDDFYRRLLIALSGRLDGWMSLEELFQSTGIEREKISMAMLELRNRNAVVVDTLDDNLFRLPQRAFALWIRNFADR